MLNSSTQKLRIWFQNHGPRKESRQQPSLRSGTSGQKGKWARSLKVEEVYSKQYYNERIKPAVKAEMEKVKLEQGVTKLSSGDRLNIVRKCTRESYENETTEVKDDITAATIAEKARMHTLVKACKTGAVSSSEERTPEDYQQ